MISICLRDSRNDDSCAADCLRTRADGKNIPFGVVEIQFPEDVPVGVIRDAMAILARYIRVLSPKAVIHMDIM